MASNFKKPISGFDLAKAIRTSNPEVIIVVFAGFISPDYQAVADEAGVAHLIPKDEWTVNDILELVESKLPELPHGKNSIGGEPKMAVPELRAPSLNQISQPPTA